MKSQQETGNYKTTNPNPHTNLQPRHDFTLRKPPFAFLNSQTVSLWSQTVVDCLESCELFIVKRGHPILSTGRAHNTSLSCFIHQWGIHEGTFCSVFFVFIMAPPAPSLCPPVVSVFRTPLHGLERIRNSNQLPNVNGAGNVNASRIKQEQ